jgi:hypothetical protein
MANELTRLRGLTRDLPPVERDSTLAGFAARMHARAEQVQRRVYLAFAAGGLVGAIAVGTVWWLRVK